MGGLDSDSDAENEVIGDLIDDVLNADDGVQATLEDEVEG